MLRDYHTAVHKHDFESAVDTVLRGMRVLDSYYADELYLRIRALPRSRDAVVAYGIAAMEGYARAIATGNSEAQRAESERLEAATAVLCGSYGPVFGRISTHGLDALLKARERHGPAWPLEWMLPCEFDCDVRGIACKVVAEPCGFGPHPDEFLNVSVPDPKPGSVFVSSTGFLRIELPVTPGRPFLPAARDFLQHFREDEPLVPVDFEFRRLLWPDPESAPTNRPGPVQVQTYAAALTEAGSQPAPPSTADQTDLFAAS